MANSARALTANQLANLVNVPAHGFSVGQIVAYNAGGWFLAKADNVGDAQVGGMVSYVPDVNHFSVTQLGYVWGLTTGPYSAGSLYYLSPSSAGTLTSTAPSTSGQIYLPCFLPDTGTSGYFFGQFGTVLGASGGGGLTWNKVTGATTSVTMTSNNGYIIAATNPVTLTVPATFAVGDQFAIISFTQSWTVNYNTNQFIVFGTHQTTTSTGSVASTNTGDSIYLVGATANVALQEINVQGNITYV